MKTFLMKFWADPLAKITESQWKMIRAVNAIAILAVIVLFATSLPDRSVDPEFLPWVLIAAIQLATALTVHVRANELERKMIEIDAENDRRDDAMSTHVEVVLQDVQWLIKREIERTGVQSLDDDIRLREIVGFDEEDHDAHVRDFLNLGKGEQK